MPTAPIRCGWFSAGFVVCITHLRLSAASRISRVGRGPQYGGSRAQIQASVAMSVESRDLSRIVVLSSKDVRFDYLVQGVRRAFKDFEPIASGMEFVPRSPEDRMPLYLTEEAKRRLIANGTYNPDGTVNMQTAERVGWTRVWKEKEERDKAAAEASAVDPTTAERKRRGAR